MNQEWNGWTASVMMLASSNSCSPHFGLGGRHQVAAASGLVFFGKTPCQA